MTPLPLQSETTDRHMAVPVVDGGASIQVQWDGKFTVSYAWDGEESAFRVFPAFGRRLVAAFNVCAGISTESLEQIKPLHIVVQDDRFVVALQRDALKEALRNLLAASQRARAQAYLSEISLRGAEDRAEAALAKVSA